MSDKYQFSIITSCKNSAKTLEQCLKSVEKQQFVKVQHIVIDACSSDNTPEILQNFARENLTSIVEADSGVYEAWNKGVAKILGTWIIFLGSDDELTSSTVLKDILNFIIINGDSKIFYGKVRKETPEGELLAYNGVPFVELDGKFDLPMRKLPPHPACVFHKSLFVDYPLFDERYKICGDSLHLGRILENEFPVFMPITVTKFRIGGLTNSRKMAIKKWREKWEVSKQLNYKIPRYLVFFSFLRAVVSRGRA